MQQHYRLGTFFREEYVGSCIVVYILNVLRTSMAIRGERPHRVGIVSMPSSMQLLRGSVAP